MNEKVNWSKILGCKAYVVVYHDPYAHSECESGCCCAETTTVMGVATSMEGAETLIKSYQKRVSYRREDFDIEEFELDGELR